MAASDLSQQAIAKLPGVRRCTIDAGQRLLSVELRLEELKAAAAPLGPRSRFDTLVLFANLDKEGFALAAGGK